MHPSRVLRLVALGLGLVVAPPLFAQKEPEPDDVTLEDEGAASESSAGESEGADDDANEEEGNRDEGDERPVPPEEDRKSTSPVEKKGETYRFVGARYRLILIPSAIMELFGQGGDTVFVHNFGPEFAIRKDGFEYQFSLTYTPYSMGDGPRSANQVAFKAPDDPEEAWEVVTSELKVVYLTADFVWSHEFSPQVQLLYGGGAGIGLVFGDLYRTQAFRSPDGRYLPCPGPPVPGMSSPEQLRYCVPEADDDPQHYPGYTEPSWADGGSKPIIFPWIALQTGLRFKPHRNFAGRLEVGVGLGQFFFGVGADYGL